MHLPDDRKIPDSERIRWDTATNRYVGNVEEEQIALPPPSMPSEELAPTILNAGGSMRRGPNRYFNPLGGTNATAAVASTMPDMNSFMAPPTFGFMPMAVDDGTTDNSPFSQQTEPFVSSTAGGGADAQSVASGVQ